MMLQSHLGSSRPRVVFFALILGFLGFLVIHGPSPLAIQAKLSPAPVVSTFIFSNAYRVVQHPVSANASGPWAITVDARGVVWFLEQGSNQLGSYDPATGAFQQFKIPTPHSTPTSLTSDVNGNVWFSELSTDKLGELTRGGSKIVEQAVPRLPITLGTTKQLLSCGPGAIISDPSGPIWFACLFSNQIDEYFPVNGTYASFDLPVFPSGPAGLLLDGHGNLWFTAADANMLGKAIISQLRNGSTDGISEFAPLNQTYTFEFTLQSSILGGGTKIKSSLPTPSGIAIDPEGRLWVTEHVDSSFDSYDPTSGSLVRYWTSQTHGDYGFAVTFPNGIAVAKDGTVWIAEHYGNRIAEFDPSNGQLTEYPAGCCPPSYVGLYNLALAGNRIPWFVEIQGNAIGELVPADDPSPVSATLPTSLTMPGSHGTVTVPITFVGAESAASSTRLSLDVSGISNTGVLRNMTATFSSNNVDVLPGRQSAVNLTLKSDNLAPGVYYLTLTATSLPQPVLHSVIIKLTVTGSSQDWLIPVIAAAGVLFIVAMAFVIWSRSRLGRLSEVREGRHPWVRRRGASFVNGFNSHRRAER